MPTLRIIFFSLILLFQCKNSENSVTNDLLKQAERPDTVSIAFYNVQNLFDLEYTGSEYVDFKPGFSNWDRDMMHKKLETIASVLLALKAEIIGLCEVENAAVLKKLLQILENKGGAFKYGAIAAEPVKSITCPALISRYPLKSSRGIGVSINGGRTRNILETDVVIGKRNLKIFVNHWPSKMNPESWRMVCAEVLSSRIKEMPDGTDYILMGDFNSDYDDHWKITTSGTDDTRGETGMHSFLKTIYKTSDNHLRYVNENDLKRSAKGVHYDLWLELPESGRMSHFYKGNRQTPDHILLPGALYDSSGISYIDNSFRSFTWDGKLLSGNRPCRWQIFGKKGIKIHTGKGYSDHLPICAQFVTAPFRFDSSQVQQSVRYSEPEFGLTGIFQKGWMLCNSAAELFTDTVGTSDDGSSLCLRGGAQKNNGCIARLTIDGRMIPSQGCIFAIQGSGRICLRNRYTDQKWRYLDLSTMKMSKAASYSYFDQKGWKKVVIKKVHSDTGNLELEIRTGKGEPFSLWIAGSQGP